MALGGRGFHPNNACRHCKWCVGGTLAHGHMDKPNVFARESKDRRSKAHRNQCL